MIRKGQSCVSLRTTKHRDTTCSTSQWATETVLDIACLNIEAAMTGLCPWEIICWYVLRYSMRCPTLNSFERTLYAAVGSSAAGK